MRQHCNIKITCPNNTGPLEFDSPVLNLSSEASDPLLFLGFGWPAFNPYAPPPLGIPDSVFTATNCANVVYNADSQLLANLLAMLNSQFCSPQAGQCANTVQSVTVNCPNGSVFQFIAEAGLFVIGPMENCQLVADEWALAWAQQQLGSVGNCFFGTFSGALRSGCLNQSYFDYVFISNPPHPTVELPADFSLISGSLPPGIVMTILPTRVVFSGTPTATGIYPFTIQAHRVSGAIETISHKAYTISVLAITNTPTAPVVGVAYSFQFTATGGTAPYTFAVTSGSLPTGLSMSTSGLITGIPTTTQTVTFTVAVTDSSP